MNEQDEELWIQKERIEVAKYVARNIEKYRAIGDIPAFHIAPIISIWAIESHNIPGSVGFWVFSGNLPGDVIPRNWEDNSDNPRKALVRMNIKWRDYIRHLRLGNNPPDIKMGTSAQQRIQMAGILHNKVEMFEEMIADDQIWDSDCSLS